MGRPSEVNSWQRSRHASHLDRASPRSPSAAAGCPPAPAGPPQPIQPIGPGRGNPDQRGGEPWTDQCVTKSLLLNERNPNEIRLIVPEPVAGLCNHCFRINARLLPG